MQLVDGAARLTTRFSSRETFLEFPKWAELADMTIRAEEATRRHVEMVARWQAAGSPRDPADPAADDLLAAHVETTYLRERIAAHRKRYATKLDSEIALAREHPREGQLVVITHARIARLKRRPLNLPKRLDAAATVDADTWVPPSARRGPRKRAGDETGTPSEGARRGRRGSARIAPADPVEARTGAQTAQSEASAFGEQFVLEIA